MQSLQPEGVKDVSSDQDEPFEMELVVDGCCLPLGLRAQPSERYKQATNQYRAGRYLEALSSIRRVLATDRSRAEYYHLYSRILAELQQFAEAEQQILKALELTPDEAQLLQTLTMMVIWISL